MDERAAATKKASQRRWVEKNRERLKIYHKQYAKDNAEKYREYSRKRRAKARKILTEYKVGVGCADCGEKHPAVLEFHHSDPSNKEFNLGDTGLLGRKLERVMEEAQKCDVLCANCHRKRHFTEGNRAL